MMNVEGSQGGSVKSDVKWQDWDLKRRRSPMGGYVEV